MKKIDFIKTAAAALLSLFAISLSACSDDDAVGAQTTKTYDMSGFAKGADVSWLTEMESKDIAFYDSMGRKNDCMKILRSLGMNASDCASGWIPPTVGVANKTWWPRRSAPTTSA